MALSGLAVYQTLPLRTILRLTAAEAAIIIAIETITSSELQDRIVRLRKGVIKDQGPGLKQHAYLSLQSFLLWRL